MRASHVVIASAQAVMDTKPPSIPDANIGISNMYDFFDVAYSIKHNTTAENPPAMAPFIVTTATRLAIFH